MELEPLTAEEGGKLALIRDEQMARKQTHSPEGFGKGHTDSHSADGSPPRMSGTPPAGKLPLVKVQSINSILTILMLPLVKAISQKMSRKASGRKDNEKGMLTPTRKGEKEGGEGGEGGATAAWSITDLHMLTADEANGNPALMVRAAHASTQVQCSIYTRHTVRTTRTIHTVRALIIARRASGRRWKTSTHSSRRRIWT
jgi:hypothetical protein